MIARPALMLDRPWRTFMDALSDVLRAVRLTGAFFFDVHARAPWCAETPLGKTVVGAMFPGSDHLISYHLLMEGTCWATVEGEDPVKLSAGDIIVLPHGDTHRLGHPGSVIIESELLERLPHFVRHVARQFGLIDDGLKRYLNRHAARSCGWC